MTKRSTYARSLVLLALVAICTLGAFLVSGGADSTMPGGGTSTVDSDGAPRETPPTSVEPLKGEAEAEASNVPGLEGRAVEAPAAPAEDAPIGDVLLHVSDPDGVPLPRGKVVVHWWTEEPEVTRVPGRPAAPGRVRAPDRRDVVPIEDGVARLNRFAALRFMRMRVEPLGEPLFEGDTLAAKRTPLMDKRLRRIDSGQPGNVRIRVTLKAGGLVEGRVLDQEGRPAVASVDLHGIPGSGPGTAEERGPSRRLRQITDGKGYFVFSNLRADAYVATATRAPDFSRRAVDARDRRHVTLRLGSIEGPHVVFREASGDPIRMSTPSLSARSVNADMYVDLGILRLGGTQLALPTAAVGTHMSLTLRRTPEGPEDDPFTVTWAFDVKDGENVLEVPPLRRARIDLVGLGASRLVGAEVRGSTRILERNGNAVDVSFVLDLSSGGREVELPEGRYKLQLKTKAGSTTFRRQLAWLHVPGHVELSLAPRRTLRVKVKGAVDMSQLEFSVDGTHGSHLVSVKGDTVVFRNVDPGPRRVTARWRWPSPLKRGDESDLPPMNVRMQVGSTLVEGESGELHMRAGKPLVFRLAPDLERRLERSQESEIWLWGRVSRDVGGVVQQQLVDGPLLGAPEGTYVTVPLEPGRYEIQIHATYHVDRLRVGSIESKAFVVPKPWSFVDLVPGGEPITLEVQNR